ncbi:putative short-chain oxidoreductase [Annulohypoxylon maeteangense]|uniref:putative short-chain oxidoreductase n=1 Tax=Annulohypoxylon maeteangense TaxID=1927788 RepID=UPI0020086AD1|nr:putative short-chain oxidoreductase [Annulohypoxylon maeteangense]KAI0889522.1 putative short-chain oxidoreductase [Annulohypoxylon maeteangense]
MSFTFTKPKAKLTWLITGCSSPSGFGMALTRIALGAGHTVIATSRNPSRTPNLVVEVESNGGRWLKLDVDDRNSGDIIEELEMSGVEIDVLVNNAGFSIFSPVETSTEEEIRGQMESMYFGPLRLIRAVLPRMRKRRYGVIANFSTGGSLEGRDTMGPYAGAKAGLDGITRVLAKEVAPYNIRTLTIILGAFNTDMGVHTVVGKNPLPEDYKGSVSDKMFQFLSSPKSKLPGVNFTMGDKDKAMRAVYEVVLGEGIGTGREAERVIPLGMDMTTRVNGIIESYRHALEAFEHVTNHVAVDK